MQREADEVRLFPVSFFGGGAWLGGLNCVAPLMFGVTRDLTLSRKRDHVINWRRRGRRKRFFRETGDNLRKIVEKGQKLKK